MAERHRKVLWNHGGASDAIARRNFRFVVTLASPASRYFVGILRMLTHVAPFANRVALVYRARGTFPPAVIDGAERYARDNDPAHPAQGRSAGLAEVWQEFLEPQSSQEES